MMLSPFLFRRMFSSALTQNVFVLNTGSSSIKFKVIEPSTRDEVLNGKIDMLKNEAVAKWTERGRLKKERLPTTDHKAVLSRVGEILKDFDFCAIGHRVVHGGEEFGSSVIVDNHVMDLIASCSHLAPLHNHINLLGMQVMKDIFPQIPQVAAFDTVFHQTMPPRAFRYAVPEEWYVKHGVRRYGFHGLSHEFVSMEVARKLNQPQTELAIVSLHLGNGCSVAASLGGVCWDTSMGFSPLEGLMMGQRSGDLDPTVIRYMCQEAGYSVDQVMDKLNKESGFLGVAGVKDSREIEELFLVDDPKGSMALEMFCYRIAKTVASYIVPLGRIDAIVITGGIGEKSSIKRKRIIELLKPLGVTCDNNWNEQHGGHSDGRISGESSTCEVFVIPTNEELIIAKDAMNLLKDCYIEYR